MRSVNWIEQNYTVADYVISLMQGPPLTLKDWALDQVTSIGIQSLFDAAKSACKAYGDWCRSKCDQQPQLPFCPENDCYCCDKNNYNKMYCPNLPRGERERCCRDAAYCLCCRATCGPYGGCPRNERCLNWDNNGEPFQSGHTSCSRGPNEGAYPYVPTGRGYRWVGPLPSEINVECADRSRHQCSSM